MILDTNSLVNTIDNINERWLFREAISADEAIGAARWIIAQQGKKGSYRGLPAPTAYDFEHGIHSFTGERLVCASARHIMGQEAARAAWLLGQSNPEVNDAYNLATGWMRAEPEFQKSGTYCCARCTLAFWRHIWAGNFERNEALIRKGLNVMEKYHTGDGKWQTFPFFYAVYTLLDLDIDLAFAELKYARPVMEKYVQKSKAGKYTKRRLAILKKALERVS